MTGTAHPPELLRPCSAEGFELPALIVIDPDDLAPDLAPELVVEVTVAWDQRQRPRWFRPAGWRRARAWVADQGEASDG